MAYLKATTPARFTADPAGSFDLGEIFANQTALALSDDDGFQFLRKFSAFRTAPTVPFDDALTVSTTIDGVAARVRFFGWDLGLDPGGDPTLGSVGGLSIRLDDGAGGWREALRLFTGSGDDPAPAWAMAELFAAAGTAGLDDDLVLLGAAFSGPPRAGGADFMILSDGDDLVRGLAGDDTIQGRRGNDDLDGGRGRDTLLGGRGDDLLHGGAGGDVLRGGAGDDTLWADGGGDQLGGGAGADILHGSLGADSFTGGHGRDVILAPLDGKRDWFTFTSPRHSAPGADSRDRVEGFEHGIDVIWLRIWNGGLLGGYTLEWSDAAAPHALWLTDLGDDVILHADTTGDTQADFEVYFAGVGTLDFADIDFPEW